MSTKTHKKNSGLGADDGHEPADIPPRGCAPEGAGSGSSPCSKKRASGIETGT